MKPAGLLRRLARRDLSIPAALCLGALILWALTGCAGVNAGACPPLKSYTPEQNQQLADELEKLPPGAFTIDVIADYMALRDQVKACQ